ncbi:MAG: MTAP family purine nucleoside phosphorylase [Fimbriimonadaceae bacterium]
MEIKAAIIGGTGVGSSLGRLPGKPLHVLNGFGMLEGRIVTVADTQVLAIQRHAGGHKVPPHAIPYLAVSRALADLGVRTCLATAAVGSLHSDLPPGSLGTCGDFIDLTARRTTAFKHDVVHTPMAVAMSPKVRQAFARAAEAAEVTIGGPWVYVGVDGPRFETPAEIRMMAALGGDVVGMTAATEAIAMAEHGIDYGCLAIVSNFAEGIAGVVSHDNVEATVKSRIADVLSLLQAAIAQLPS